MDSEVKIVKVIIVSIVHIEVNDAVSILSVAAK